MAEQQTAQKDENSSESTSVCEEIQEEEQNFKDLGNASFKNAQYLSAISFYTKAIEQKPTAVLYGNRAFCHIKLENFGSAIVDADAALKLNQKYLKAYYRRGSAFLSLGKYKKALACFKQVLLIKPKSKDAKKKRHKRARNLSKLVHLQKLSKRPTLNHFGRLLI